jgi:hypothetical protein
MTYRAIYAYAWDVAEVGAAAFADEVLALGLDTVTFAGAYHAGKFLRPKGKAGKVFFPEDGTAYFRFDPQRYGRLKPALNSQVREQDILRELSDVRGIAVNAWMVLLHNTRFGTLHPDATVENAFGDRYVYSLCPSSPDARAYAVALCKDISDNYPVTGLSLETPGFLPYAHGFHHEFALVKQNSWFKAQMGLCFCANCIAGAETAGIDASRLRTKVAKDINAWLDDGIELPADMAEAFLLADVAAGGDLAAFLDWRCDVVTSLVGEIRAAIRKDAALAVIPSVARPTAGCWYEGTDICALSDAGCVIEACFYEPSVARVQADVFDVKRRIGGADRLRGILRPAFPDLQSSGEVTAAASALRDAGVTEIAFYNYGHLGRRNLASIADALAAFGG